MAFRGVFLKKGADQTTVDFSSGANIVFNDASSEIQDTDGFHDNSSNPERITIPAAVNGMYGIFTGFASIESYTPPSVFFIQKTSPVAGQWGIHSNGGANGHVANASWWQTSLRATQLVTGDVYVFQGFATDASVTVKAETSFGLVVLQTFSGGHCLAKKSADQTGADYSTPTVIAWDGTDVYDTHAAHNPSSSNTKIVIPASLNNKWLVFRASVAVNNMTASLAHSVIIRRTRSATPSLVYDGVGAQSELNSAFTTACSSQCATQAIQAATGDEYEVVYYNADTSVDIIAARSNFGFFVVA
jgi:hypothetical protein